MKADDSGGITRDMAPQAAIDGSGPGDKVAVVVGEGMLEGEQ